MMKSGRAERKRRKSIGVAVILCTALFLSACAGSEPVQEQTGQAADWQAERQNRDRRTKQDSKTMPDDEEETSHINLDDHKGKIVVAEGGDVWLSGSLEGQVVVDAQEDELVHLYLEDVEISSGQGPAIRIEEASKVIVTLVSGTGNTLKDGTDYSDYEECPACLFSACDLTINGDGTLRVYGYYEDGIRSKDRLKLLSGSVEVHARGDGIRGNDGILLKDASVDVQSEGHGLYTVKQGADDRGVIEIDGGVLSVVAGQKGIFAASGLYMYRCVCNVNAVEEKVKTEGEAYIADGCLR